MFYTYLRLGMVKSHQQSFMRNAWNYYLALLSLQNYKEFRTIGFWVSLKTSKTLICLRLWTPDQKCNGNEAQKWAVLEIYRVRQIVRVYNVIFRTWMNTYKVRWDQCCLNRSLTKLQQKILNIFYSFTFLKIYKQIQKSSFLCK